MPSIAVYTTKSTGLGRYNVVLLVHVCYTNTSDSRFHLLQRPINILCTLKQFSTATPVFQLIQQNLLLAYSAKISVQGVVNTWIFLLNLTTGGAQVAVKSL